MCSSRPHCNVMLLMLNFEKYIVRVIPQVLEVCYQYHVLDFCDYHFRLMQAMWTVLNLVDLPVS